MERGRDGGASLVEATQTSQTFTGSASFIRAVPTENWMDARNRTTLDLSASYGKLTQPNTPTLRTASITRAANATNTSRRGSTHSDNWRTTTTFHRVWICSRLMVAASDGPC